MVQVTATIERVGPKRAQLYVKVPRFLTVKIEELPFGIQKGETVELVLRPVESEQQGLEKA